MRGVAVVLGVTLAVSPASAAVLCKHKKTGALAIRAACTRKQVQVGTTQLTVNDTSLDVSLPTTTSSSTTSTTSTTSTSLPHPAAGSTQLLSHDVATSSTTAVKLDSFTVQVPGAGTLTVTVAGFYWLDADAAGANSIHASFDLGLCDTEAAFDACGGALFEPFVHDPDNASGNNATPAFTLTRTVSVAGAGSRTFYVNGAVSDGSHTLHLWGHNDGGIDDGTKGPFATAIFTPAALTVTRP
jgi:hypothetical protein